VRKVSLNERHNSRSEFIVVAGRVTNHMGVTTLSRHVDAAACTPARYPLKSSRTEVRSERHPVGIMPPVCTGTSHSSVVPWSEGQNPDPLTCNPEPGYV